MVGPEPMSASSTEIRRDAAVVGDQIVRSRWFDPFARTGFVARALVYALLGFLVVELARGHWRTPANQKGALETVAHQPFGGVLLTLLAIGLGAYATWALFRAALGHGPEDTDSGFARFSRAASAVVYAAFCGLTIEILVTGGGSSASPKGPPAGVLGWPGGRVMVGIAGAVLIGVALYQAYQGVSRRFLLDSKTEQMGSRTKRAITVLGVAGYLARAAVFVLVGVFVIKAAVDFTPHDAVGLDGALARLAGRSYGPYLLGAIAAGLFAFAIFSLGEARYRRI
jgi:hypothetical protein